MEKIKLVIIAMFEPGESKPGELFYVRERFGLRKAPCKEAGLDEVYVNGDGVLAALAGVGTANTATAITALGMCGQYDFSGAYWIITGIAGVNPNRASLGSPIWADWVVDGDLAHEIDPREMPEGWQTGIFPLASSEPYKHGSPADNLFGKPYQVFQLNQDLVQKAFELSKQVDLVEDPKMDRLRSRYQDFEYATQKPAVAVGAQLAAARFWHGKLMNDWAEKWLDFWTQGQGAFVTSGMEDTGTLQAITHLQLLSKADFSKVLVLRTGSNFTMQPVGMSAAESLAGDPREPYPAYACALENAARVVEVVGRALIE